VTRYRCVDARKAEGFGVAAACAAAEVSTSAFYAWRQASIQPPSRRQLDEAALLERVRRVHAESGGTYGSPRVTAQLRRDGVAANHKRVEALMARNGLVGHRPRRRRCLTRADRTVPPAPDLVGRLFDPDRPDVAWCGDLTYVPTGEGWLYLASVLDLASRRLLGYSMGDRHDAGLVVDALDAAVAARGRPRMAATIFHSDRGAEGELNRSSQRLTISEVFDGTTSAAGGSGFATGDAVPGSSDAGPACRAGVLAPDWARQAHGGRRARGRRVDAGRLTLVSPRWRHAALKPGRAHRPLSVVPRAGGARCAEGAGLGCPRDRS